MGSTPISCGVFQCNLNGFQVLSHGPSFRLLVCVSVPALVLVIAGVIICRDSLSPCKELPVVRSR